MLQGTPVFDTFRVFDPRLPPGRAGLDRAKGPFREALTFMIGGGNYLEREALVAWASRATPQRQVGGQQGKLVERRGGGGRDDGRRESGKIMWTSNAWVHEAVVWELIKQVFCCPP